MPVIRQNKPENHKRIRDSQRQAVYRWEQAVMDIYRENNPTLTFAQCRDLVWRVWGEYRPGEQAPIVKDGRGRRSACGGRRSIKLPIHARCKVVVLHEIAHSLQTEQPWHGGQFTRLVSELWEHYAGIPGDQIWLMGVRQKPRAVHFGSAAGHPKPMSPAWLAWKREKERLIEAYCNHLRQEPPKY